MTNQTDINTSEGVRVVPEPIAIVGMAMRLPGGVNTAAKFWDMLISKRDGRIRVPEDRYNVDAFYDAGGKDGMVKTQYGNYLQENLGHFDPSFFSMTRSEIKKLEPQSRLLLEVTREALENAGETGWSGKDIGCYVGTFGEDWYNMHNQDPQDSGTYRMIGYSDFIFANRISYEYNMKGPSVTVKTACSASMIALDMACKAIGSGQCRSAIVAGSNLILTPSMTIAMCEQGVVGPDGICKTFDAQANGYGRGEAINALYIKSLSEAIKDGNPIQAVIRGTASNSDGKTPGITHPNSDSHEALMRDAYRAAGLEDFDRIGFVECHGTGTAIGDPIETKAVARVFGKKGVYIGACKPNFGHSEGASGITGVIKAVLALQHRTIPPNVHFETPNPKIPFDKLTVPTDAIPWPQDRAERICVNSFGVGGANAAVILESASTLNAEPTPPSKPLRAAKNQLLVFSANNPASLNKITADMKAFLDTNPGEAANLAHTLGACREHLPMRSYCITGDIPLDGTTGTAPSSPPKINFVFSGQGAQWVGMGRELLSHYPDALETVKTLDKALQALPDHPAWSLGEALTDIWSGGPPISYREKEKRIAQPEFAQPLCTAVQIIIVNLLMSWGVRPDAVVGHSSGEIATAYAAGAVTQEEAIILAFYRGLVSQSDAAEGGMASVGLGREAATPFLVDGVVVACENGPENITLSGELEKLDQVIQNIDKGLPGTFARKLKVKVAYHSDQIKPAAEDYAQRLQSHITPKKPALPFYSSVKGSMVSKDEPLDTEYWKQTMASPVRFFSAVQTLLEDNSDNQVFIEVGPHAALQGPLRQIFASRNATNVQYISTLIPNTHAVQALLRCLGEIYVYGVTVDFAALSPGKVVTSLSPYPWDHETEYWDESRVSRDWRLRRFSHHDLLGSRVNEGSDLEPLWRNVLRLQQVPWISDHLVQSNIVFPGAGYIAMAGEAVRQLTGVDDFTIRDVTFASAMVLNEEAEIEIVTSLRPLRLTTSLDSAFYEFCIMTYNGTWTKHCFGKVRGGSEYEPRPPKHYPPCPRKLPSRRCYQAMTKSGLRYGPRFQGLRDVATGTTEMVARGTVSNEYGPSESKYTMHPTTIDFCFQLFGAATAYGQPRNFDKVHLPSAVESLYVGSTNVDIHMFARGKKASRGAVLCDGTGTSSTGQIVFQLRGLKLAALEQEANEGRLQPHIASRLYWKPDMDFVSLDGIVKSSDMTGLRAEVDKVERLSLLCIMESSGKLKDVETSEPHYRRYRAWFEEEISRARAGKNRMVPDAPALLALCSDDRLKEIDALTQDISEGPLRPRGIGVRRVFDHCVDFFEGKAESLEVLMRDNILHQIYDLSAKWEFGKLFSHLCHSRPWLRVLEVGAGTGGTTATVLPHLSFNGECMYSLYHLTDVSAGFLTQAKERFAQYSHVEYSTLDISKEPTGQGFAAESYDVIIASNVLHATPSLTTTLQNVRRLLRPDGYLILDELCPTTKAVNHIMGTFSGWWLGADDGRPWEPYVHPDRWTEVMRGTGFTEPAVVYDEEFPYQSNALMITRPRPKSSPTTGKMITLLCDDSPQLSLVGTVESRLKAAGYTTQRCTLAAAPSPRTGVISFLDMKEPFFENISEERLQSLVRFLQGIDSDSGMLWCTRASQFNCSDPRWAQCLGFARAMRTEMALDLATLELDSCGVDAAPAIVSVLDKFNNRNKNEEYDPEFEWVLDNGQIHIGRYHWYSMAEELSRLGDSEERAAKRLKVGKPGFLNSLGWISRPLPVPVRDQVVVEVRAVGMNFVDLLMAQGVVDGPPGDGHDLGTELAGIVVEIGPDVADLRVGDRVMGLLGGTQSTAVLTAAQRCVPIPPDLSFEEAATMPTVYCTIIHSLIHVARMKTGQTILIHSACGGTGNAAIQLSRMIGADIYATVGSEEKVKYLMDNFDIPLDHIFNSRNMSFLPDILEATDGRGVDVVLNSLSGELLHASWKCVAPYGRMVELGKRDFFGQARLEMETFAPNRSFLAVDAQRIRDERPAWARKLLDECMEYYNKGLIGPIHPVTSFPATDVQAAFRFMQKGSHLGKLVVQYPSNPADLQEVPQKPELTLKPDVSYLLVGGLGGLGRAVSTWMVEHRAKSLVYLSRSAGNSEEDRDFFHELESQGCICQAFPGSASSQEDVRRAIQGANMPVRGILMLSMVLRDKPVEQMAIEDWDAAVQPKVHAAWNLHKATKALPLDFMVLFSSSSGIMGLSGQSNYASANTFLDAFVQYRHANGLVASVLDIGVIEDIGYVSTNKVVLERFRAANARTLNEADLLESLHLAMLCSNPQPYDEAFVNHSQIGLALGVTRPIEGRSNQLLNSKDRRLAVYRNLEDTDDHIDVGGTDGKLSQFIAEIRSNPPILRNPSSSKLLALEIGKTLHDFLLLPTDAVDTSRPISSMGVDSLVAIELRNWCRHKLGLEMTILEIMDLASLDAFGQFAAQRLYAKYSGEDQD